MPTPSQVLPAPKNVLPTGSMKKIANLFSLRLFFYHFQQLITNYLQDIRKRYKELLDFNF